MKLLLSIAAASAALLSTATAGETPANIQSAIDNPLRTEENRARDEARKPAKVLSFFGIEEGMTVVDVGSGSGYFTEILSGAVGPNGKVHAQLNSSSRVNDSKDALTAKYEKFSNISLDITDRGAPLPYDDNSVDVVLFALLIHHYHYNEASGDSMPATSSEFYSDVKRVLKPGGIFAVIEHKAADGSSRQESAGWHRISENIMKEDITSAGFIFDGSAENIHYNPDDNLKSTWFDELRGKTTRIVHRYKKPAE